MFDLDDLPTSDLDATDPTGADTEATDTPPEDGDQPGKRVLTLGGQRFEVEDPSLAESLQRAFDRQAGRLGSRLQEIERENQELRGYLQARPEAPDEGTPRAQPAREDDDRDPELPGIQIPDRDLWLTQPDVAARMMADAIDRREKALLAHTRRSVQRVREEGEALAVASVRETARELQARDERTVAQRAAEANSMRRWNEFYKGNPDLAPHRETVELVFQAAKAQLPSDLPTEIALDLIAKKSRDIITKHRGGTAPTVPRTLTGGGPRGGGRPAERAERAEDDIPMSELISRRQEALRNGLRGGQPPARRA